MPCSFYDRKRAIKLARKLTEGLNTSNFLQMYIFSHLMEVKYMYKSFKCLETL